MTITPSFESYGQYSSDNYGAHALVFTLPWGGHIWVSYKTPVAFAKNGKRVVRQNAWGPTTGKHLNWIDAGDHKARVTGPEFKAALELAFGA